MVLPQSRCSIAPCSVISLFLMCVLAILLSSPCVYYEIMLRIKWVCCVSVKSSRRECNVAVSFIRCSKICHAVFGRFLFAFCHRHAVSKICHAVFGRLLFAVCHRQGCRQESPVRGLTYGFQGTINAKKYPKNHFSPSDGG